MGKHKKKKGVRQVQVAVGFEKGERGCRWGIGEQEIEWGWRISKKEKEGGGFVEEGRVVQV